MVYIQSLTYVFGIIFYVIGSIYMVLNINEKIEHIQEHKSKRDEEE